MLIPVNSEVHMKKNCIPVLCTKQYILMGVVATHLSCHTDSPLPSAGYLVRVYALEISVSTREQTVPHAKLYWQCVLSRTSFAKVYSVRSLKCSIHCA